MLKTFSFTLMHFSIAFTVAYLLTGDIMVGGLVAMVEPAVNTVVLYHSRKNLDPVTTGRKTTVSACISRGSGKKTLHWRPVFSLV